MPKRGIPMMNPAPWLPRYVLGMGRFQPGMPWPCMRSIFSSRVISFSTSSARWSGERPVFIQGCTVGFVWGPAAFAPTVITRPRIAAKTPRKNLIFRWFNLPPSISRLSLLTAEQLEVAVVELYPTVIGVYCHALILAVLANVVDVDGDPVDPVGRQASLVGVLAIGRTRFHYGNHRGAGPHLGHELL